MTLFLSHFILVIFIFNYFWSSHNSKLSSSRSFSWIKSTRRCISLSNFKLHCLVSINSIWLFYTRSSYLFPSLLLSAKSWSRVSGRIVFSLNFRYLWEIGRKSRAENSCLIIYESLARSLLAYWDFKLCANASSSVAAYLFTRRGKFYSKSLAFASLFLICVRWVLCACVWSRRKFEYEIDKYKFIMLMSLELLSFSPLLSLKFIETKLRVMIEAQKQCSPTVNLLLDGTKCAHISWLTDNVSTTAWY